MNSAEIKCQKRHFCDIFGSCTSITKHDFKTNHNTEVTVDECTLIHSFTLLHTATRDIGTPLKTKMTYCIRCITYKMIPWRYYVVLTVSVVRCERWCVCVCVSVLVSWEVTVIAVYTEGLSHKRSKSSSYSIYQLTSFQRKYKTDLPKGLTQHLYINSLTTGRNSNRISQFMLPIRLWLSHLRGPTSTAQQPWINIHSTLHTNTSTWKNRTKFANIIQNIPSRHHTLYTSDHNPENEKIFAFLLYSWSVTLYIGSTAFNVIWECVRDLVNNNRHIVFCMVSLKTRKSTTWRWPI